MKLKISIITVCFNSSRTIKDTIDSVLNQSYPNIEHIIIDGNSTDGTQEIVSSYGDSIKSFISEQDTGLYDAMNKGIKLATGEIVGILNSDDIFYDKEVISHVADTFTVKDCDAVYGDVVYCKQNNLSSFVRYYSSKKFKLNDFKKGLMPAHPSFFVKKVHYDNIGLYDPTYKISSDFDLLLRFLYFEKINAIYTPNILVVMRMGGISTQGIKSLILINKEHLMILKKHKIKTNNFILYSRYFGKILEFTRMPKNRHLKR